MLGNLFHKDDDEKRQMAEGRQSTSDQIGALSRQLTYENAEITRLQATASSAASDALALQAARQKVDELQQQLRELQRTMAEEQAARDAEKMAAGLIHKPWSVHLPSTSTAVLRPFITTASIMIRMNY